MTAEILEEAAELQVAVPDDPAPRLTALVTRLGSLLPSQGPLSSFAFLNPLQEFESLPFEEGMLKAARLFGCKAYMSEEAYRKGLADGRILLDDLRDVLRTEMGESGAQPVLPTGTRFDMRLAMVRHPLTSAQPDELKWFIAETNALTRFSDELSPAVKKRFRDATRQWILIDDSKPQEPNLISDLIDRFGRGSVADWDESAWETLALQSLWRVCRDGVQNVEIRTAVMAAASRHRDLLLEATGSDSDLLVHPVLIRFCAAFTDQGLSSWMLPDRDEGVFQAFCKLYQSSAWPAERWLRPLSHELARIAASGQSAAESLCESLEDLGVPEQEWEQFLESTGLALRGWAGIIWQMEVREDRVAKSAPRGSLLDFLAIRLLLERLALRELGRCAGIRIGASLADFRQQLHDHLVGRSTASIEQRAFLVFQLAQFMGWTPPDLHRLGRSDWQALITEVESFPAIARRRILHLAFENRLRVTALDAVAHRVKRAANPVASPQFQAVFCIDAREESFRRHLEEQSRNIETFSAAGFFGVAMYYRGAADAHFSAQCPVIVRPKHWVVEDPAYPFEKSHQFRARSRRALGLAVHQIHLDSRSFGAGAFLAAGLGTLASIPLVMRVMFPRLTAMMRRTLGSIVAPPEVTRLRLERTLPAPGPNPGEIGFSVEEMANIGERMLRDIALTSKFARLVFFIGHGSACQNNPHKSTYDCGACTGNPGGPNGRALAAMLNHPKVRRLLASRGIPVPDETVFLGGLHNTCDDTVKVYDLDQLPKSHYDDFAAARRAFDEACRRNAHERCRRFYSAPLTISLNDALRHVKDRSEDLAQTRPEFGNATNALCFVGRRSRIRGLFLDRRSFLQSYDPSTDPDFTILARILAPVIPVCNGINMQYYLSAMDPHGWGCGSKLPHNIASLLGIMDGAASDLRCGLPAQGVEIHEPVRLLFILETTPAGILKIMSENETIGRILKNGWSQLAILDPNSDQIQAYVNGRFEPYCHAVESLPTAASSAEWYRGRRDHLPFAMIE